MKIMEVVSGVAIRAGADGKHRALLGQRAPPSSHALCWVSLGGKIEPMESWEEALARELSEEAGLCAPNHAPAASGAWWRALAKRWTPLYEYGGTSTTTGAPFRVRCFWVFAGIAEFNNPQPSDGIVGLGWFAREEVAILNLGPADAANREVIMGLLRGNVSA